MATATVSRSARPRHKIRSNDLVQVQTGKDAGRRGVVKQVIPAQDRIVVEQVNMMKRHTKARPPVNQQSQGTPGGVIEREAPLHISNVQLVCPACDKPTRVGYRLKEDGRKVRACRNADCRSDIDR